LDIELPSRVDFHRLAQNQEGAKLLVPTAATAALLNRGGPSKDLASLTRRSFPLLDPPWPYLERPRKCRRRDFVDIVGEQSGWQFDTLACGRGVRRAKTPAACSIAELKTKEHPRSENDRQQKTNHRKLSVIR
jgi:hypothetical protein